MTKETGCAGGFSEEQMAILRALQDGSGMSSEELGEPTRGTRRRLLKEGLIESSDNKSWTVYTLTPKGRRTLATIDAGSGEVAQLRCVVSTARYTGERPMPVRAGAMDAYSLPSLHDGERMERKRPMLIGGHVEAVRQGRS